MSATDPVEANKEAFSPEAENSAHTGVPAGVPRDQSGRDGATKRSIPSMGSQVEFLPEHIRQQRLRRRRLIRQGYLLVACVAAMGILTLVRGERVAQARGSLATLEKRKTSLQQQAAMVTSLERQMSDLLIKKRIDEELGSRTNCTVVLAELCRITPPNIVVVSLDLRTVELSAEASGHSGRSSPRAGRGYRGSRPIVAGKSASKDADGTVRRARLVITGLATNDVDVANFIGQLSASRLFKNVNMGYTKTIVFRKRSAREFQASCYLAQ